MMAFKRKLIDKLREWEKERFPFTPNVDKYELMLALNTSTTTFEAIIRLRGELAERLLCSKYSLIYHDESNKKTAKEILNENGIQGCDSNLTPDAYHLTEDGKVIFYEFGISKYRKVEKEYQDRKKWFKVQEKFPIIVQVEIIENFENIENSYIKKNFLEVEHISVQILKKLETNDDLREINLKYYWDIKDLFQQYPYSKSIKTIDPKKEAIDLFPELDVDVHLPKGGNVRQLEQALTLKAKNVASKAIENHTSFYVKTNKQSITNLLNKFKTKSLEGHRMIKRMNQGFSHTISNINDFFESNAKIIKLINLENKQKKLKKLEYSFIFTMSEKLENNTDYLVVDAHDSLKWLSTVKENCTKQLKNGGKNAIKEHEHLKKLYQNNKNLFDSYKKLNEDSTKKLQLAHNMIETNRTTKQTPTKPETSHNENFIINCAKERINHWKHENLENVQNFAHCAVRCGQTSYTYSSNFLCYQHFENQTIFYKTKGSKTKTVINVTIEGIKKLKLNPSRYLPLLNIISVLENITLEYYKLSGKNLPEELKNVFIEIFVNQNKTTQKNIQNIRYVFMALNSKYHSRELGNKVACEIKNEKNTVDYYLIKKIIIDFMNNKQVSYFDNTESKNLELRRALFMSYICNLITKDSQEKDIERIKANKKYFEPKLNYQDERSWMPGNGLSIEELAYKPTKKPTICLEALKLFYNDFKLSSIDYFDKYSLTKLKEPLAFDVANSNSCMTHVKTQKNYNFDSITNQVRLSLNNKLAMINKKGIGQFNNENKSKIESENAMIKQIVEFYDNSGLSWIIRDSRQVELHELCNGLPYLEGLREMALLCVDDEEDDLSSIIKKRIKISNDPDGMHFCILMKLKECKQNIRILTKNRSRGDKFVNKLSSRNSSSIELLNNIRKEKLKNKEVISELTCLDLIDELKQLNFGLSYKEQVGGTRELYVGDIDSKIATKVVEEFVKQLSDLNPLSCLYNHESEDLIRKHVAECQNINKFETHEDFINMTSEQAESLMEERQTFLFGSLDHSKWGPTSMPFLFAILSEQINDAVEICLSKEKRMDCISDILWKHVTKNVEVSSEYAEYLIKNIMNFKTNSQPLARKDLDEIDQYCFNLLKENKLGLQKYPFDMGQGILHGWSDLWAGKTEEFIWRLINTELGGDQYTCVTSDDQATIIMNIDNDLLAIEMHYILSKLLNKKMSEKSTWGTKWFEFKSVFVSEGQEISPTIKFLAIPCFGFEVYDPLNFLNTTDTIIQSAFDNCANIQQCKNLLKMSKKLLSCAGFGKLQLEKLSHKHFYKCDIHPLMFDDMTFTERKLYSLMQLINNKSILNSQFILKCFSEIDDILKDWQRNPLGVVSLSKKRIVELLKLEEQQKIQNQLSTWDPVKDGPIRVCSGRMKNTKENNIILSLDPCRQVEDPKVAKLYNFIRKHFQCVSYNSLEQSIIESIKDTLRTMSNGENFSGLVSTCRSNCFKLGDKHVNMEDSMNFSTSNVLEDYLQLKIQILIETLTLETKHYINCPGSNEDSKITTESRGSFIDQDFLIPALASIEKLDKDFFENVVKPTIPLRRLTIMNPQQLIRMDLIQEADASFNMEFREPHNVFRIKSVSFNCTYHQGDDGFCWERTGLVGKMKFNDQLQKLESRLILNSFIKPTPINYETIFDTWMTFTNDELKTPLLKEGDEMQILIANAVNEKRQIIISELYNKFPQHLSDKRIYNDEHTFIVSKELCFEGQSVIITFVRDKFSKTSSCTMYWTKLPSLAPKSLEKSFFRELLDDDQLNAWIEERQRIKNKLKSEPSLYDKLSSPALIRQGSIGYYKFVDHIPTFQEVFTPKLNVKHTIECLSSMDISQFMTNILKEYSLLGETVYERMIETKPDYLSTKTGNILTFKRAINTTIQCMQNSKEQLQCMKLFNDLFDESIIVEFKDICVMSKPGLDGWLASTDNRFLVSRTSRVSSFSQLVVLKLEVEEEKSWL
ncbi:RNA-dependent RNA polymerase [andere Heimat virus 1]|uniref:RNA-directed RNA polymerase L n=1 Tax=andere Heimat virus 1 TaxID=2847049 RepID=A0A6C0PIU1_9VIRU|nr:RNA-dependent RNA polymerase [andere Heimat virus 1]QHX39769.1 RNA-dependent RNA polymerase [andere Heimat virus 1]QHX39781.1 RNA-dependent RNA polymerase [andere Heimat virus 1]